ncbi:MAG TPA: PLP-dependent aspartate aminotransferase family protein, partial [Pyrinomonadaceae bacterium]|nr:PLP-dependent aspartate aminotransferase family protein [Pyrinomonadaceae bacterium]
MAPESFNTLSVHAGDLGDHFGALSVPIYTASIFAFPDADEAATIHNELKPGYYYGRLGNPTTAALERVVAELENAESAVAFSSGMSAVTAAVLSACKSGDHLVAPKSMYSTATNLFRYLEDRFRIETSFIDATTAQNYRESTKENTKLYWLETPSNPLLQITDLQAVSSIAKEAGIATVADNTFATPYNQRPLELGVDAVIHSATKYLGGHSDLTAGVVAGNPKIVETARHEAGKLFGGNIAPQVAWL